MRRGKVLVLLAVLIALVVSGCTQPGVSGGTPSTPGKPEAPQKTGQQGLPYRVDGQKTIFGPFSSEMRGIDYFWTRDGKKLLVTLEKDGAQQLWLVEPATKASRLLRQADGVDAMFPIGYAGTEKVILLEIPREPSTQNAVVLVDFSAGKSVVNVAGQFDGRAKGQAVTADGKYVTVHYSSSQGGVVRRLDTITGTATDLITGLPINDGLYPVWFSPDGTAAAMPVTSDNGQAVRLKLLNILTGKTTTTAYSHKYIDAVYWSSDARHIAYKAADGSHKLAESADTYIVLSPKVRIATATGEVARDITVPEKKMAGSIAWVDANTLVILERTASLEAGAAWFARLDGTTASAQPVHLAALERMPEYPMPKGAGQQLSATIRSWQDPGKPPFEELILGPKL